MSAPITNRASAGGEDCPAAVSQAGLARALEAVERRVAELIPLGTRVDKLAATVSQLAQHVLDAETSKDGAASKVVPSWLDIDHDGPSRLHTRDILDRLTPWVGGVYLRYSDAKVPDCWLWHPDVVEELLWLHAAWLTAYHPDAPATAAGDWHERQRPGVVARIKAYAGLCSLEAHLPGKERHRPAPTTPTDDAVLAIATWWARHREEPGPVPTEEQIAAATEHLHRNRR